VKSLVMMIGWMLIAVVTRASVIATDDFSGGTIGNELDGVAVQSGAGTWTKSYSAGYSGNLVPLVYSTGGVGVPPSSTSGNGAILGDYSAYTNIQVSTEFYVGSSKTNGPAITLGFFETINKTYIQNIGDDDVVSCKFVTSGPNEGMMIWRIVDEGVVQESSYQGSPVSFASNDLVRLTLSYNLLTGEAACEAYNVSQGSLINTGSANVPGVGGFKYAAMGLISLVADAADPFYFKNIQVEGEGSLPVPPQYGVVASDDFSDGTIGDELDGIFVQSGFGVWTKDYSAGTSGSMGPLAFSAEGVGAPTGSSGGNMALLNDYSGYTNTLQVSTVFSVGSSKANSPLVTLGFFETINKGYLQNIVADDFVACRFITNGGSEGRVQWKIYDEGVAKDTSLDGVATSFASNDVIRLTLSYNFQTGEAVAEAYNLTQSSVINTYTASVTGLSGFNYAAAGVSSVTSDTDPFYFSSFEVEAVSAGYAGWAAGWGVELGDDTADYDNDGLSNIYEYGLGGNPTNAADQGISPVSSVGDGVLTYIYPQLSDSNSGLTYHLETRDDLMTGSWANAGYTVTGTNLTAGAFNYITNQVPTDVKAQQFIKLIIE
jgi:hypothetical protein